MKTYSQVRTEVEEKLSATTPTVRTDYRCRAHGCPNAGTIEGCCYFHFREPEPSRWDEVTRRIRANFDTMRNH